MTDGEQFMAFSLEAFWGHVVNALELPESARAATAETLLADDLGLDSIAMLEFVYVVEEMTGRVIDPEGLDAFPRTVGEAYEIALALGMDISADRL